MALIPTSDKKSPKYQVLRNIYAAIQQSLLCNYRPRSLPEELCQCPQKCDERVPSEIRERLFSHFYGLGDPDLQNAFLRDHMDVRARPHVPEPNPPATPGSGRSPRRITCKYLVPLLPSREETVEVCQKAFVSAFVITTKRVRLQREKLISSMGLNSYAKNGKGNAAAVHAADAGRTEEEDEEDEEDNSSGDAGRRMLDDPLLPLGLLVPEGVTIAPVVATPDHDRDIAIVNNFFSNQLWKPEYIGTY